MRNDLSRCSRLSQLQKGGDIGFLSPAIKPGSHCPLFGVVMCAPFIKDLAVIITGEGECCWNAYNHFMSQGSGENFYTYSMDDMDIIYGCGDKLAAAAEALYKIKPFKALMLVSSCIPELTGEDIDKIASGCRLPVPVLRCHTAHYNSTGYTQGITNFYAALSPLLKENYPANHKVALLGSRYEGSEVSEIPMKIRQAGREFLMPESVHDIEELSGAELSVVLDVTALELAKELENRCGVPYVRIDRLLCPEKLLDAYRRIDSVLGTDMALGAEKKASELRERMCRLKNRWQNKTFLLAAPFCLPFETMEFFCSMGMKPLFVAARDIYEGDSGVIEGLKAQGIDCPVCSFASMGNMEELYRKIDADLYFGFILARTVSEKALLINPAPMGAVTGFAFPEWIIKSMESFGEGGANGL